MIMEKIVDKLVSEGFEIQKLETWHNKENEKIFEDHDTGEVLIKGDNGYEADQCYGVPFLLNKATNKAICGEATYEEVKSWAEGK
jgi:hypothetical protein